MPCIGHFNPRIHWCQTTCPKRDRCQIATPQSFRDEILRSASEPTITSKHIRQQVRGAPPLFTQRKPSNDDTPILIHDKCGSRVTINHTRGTTYICARCGTVEKYEISMKTIKTRGPRHCSKCKETGHDARNCKRDPAQEKPEIL